MGRVVPWALISLFLAVDPTNPPPAAPDEPPAVIFATTKAIDTVQKCLTDRLSEVGEVAAVQPDGENPILLVRGNPDGPMVVELAPKSVKVTTKLISGTKEIIKACT
jgi:hypothetical protein